MTQPRIVRVCRGEEVDRRPVWFMRQAGRYLPEYREIRARYSLLEICRRPPVAAEVTLQPLRRFDLDAAIIFADILLPLECLGIGFRFAKGEGPKIDRVIQAPQDVERLETGDPCRQLSFVLEAISLVRQQLDPEVAMVGFAGGPFTVASYVLEGGSSRHFIRTKEFMSRHPEAWHRFLDKITEVTCRYLQGQVEAGAQVVQLFDSWVGCLDPWDYIRYVQPHSRRIFDFLKSLDVVSIHFGTATAGLLPLLQEAGGDAIGIDWRISLAQARRELGEGTVLQGNLDPVALLSPSSVLRQKVGWVLSQAGKRGGHIFNLGHGILPATPPENVQAVTEWVHRPETLGLPEADEPSSS